MISFANYALLNEAEYKIQEKDSTIKKVLDKLAHVRNPNNTFVKIAVLDKSEENEAKIYNIDDILVPASAMNRASKVKKITLSYDEDVEDELKLSDFIDTLKKFTGEGFDPAKILIQAELRKVVREMNVVFYYDDETNVVFLCVGGYAKLPSVRKFVERLKNQANAADATTTQGGGERLDLSDEAREDAAEETGGNPDTGLEQPAQSQNGPVTVAGITYEGEYVVGSGVPEDYVLIYTKFNEQQFKNYLRSEPEEKIKYLVGDYTKLRSVGMTQVMADSWIESLAWRPDKTLAIAMKRGDEVRIYKYKNISAQMAFELITTDSVGSYYSRNIRRQERDGEGYELFPISRFAPSADAPEEVQQATANDQPADGNSVNANDTDAGDNADANADNADGGNREMSFTNEQVDAVNAKLADKADEIPELEQVKLTKLGPRERSLASGKKFAFTFQFDGVGMDPKVGDEAEAFLNDMGCEDAVKFIKELDDLNGAKPLFMVTFRG